MLSYEAILHHFISSELLVQDNIHLLKKEIAQSNLLSIFAESESIVLGNYIWSHFHCLYVGCVLLPEFFIEHVYIVVNPLVSSAYQFLPTPLPSELAHFGKKHGVEQQLGLPLLVHFVLLAEPEAQLLRFYYFLI